MASRRIHLNPFVLQSPVSRGCLLDDMGVFRWLHEKMARNRAEGFAGTGNLLNDNHFQLTQESAADTQSSAARPPMLLL